jgi:hypothetical protein
LETSIRLLSLAAPSFCLSLQAEQARKRKTTVNMGVAEKIKEIEEEMKRTQ